MNEWERSQKAELPLHGKQGGPKMFRCHVQIKKNEVLLACGASNVWCIKQGASAETAEGTGKSAGSLCCDLEQVT